MTAPTVTGTPQVFSFTATGTVVTYTGGGSTGTGVVDVLCVNSDNVVTTPSGWSLLRSEVANQGSYVYTKDGGSTSATIDLGGGVSTNTNVVWVRLKDVNTSDIATGAQVNASAGSATPAVTTAALAESGELVLAFAAVHSFAIAPSSPVWSSGYVQQGVGSIGTTGSGAYGNVAVKTPAGTAAESPSLSWTGPAFNRYLLVVSFTGAAAVASAAPDSVAVSVSVGSPSVSVGLSVVPDSITAPVVLGAPFILVTPASLSVPVVLGEPTVGEAPAPARRSGGWETFGNALRFNADQERFEAENPPKDCPNDGEPLQFVRGVWWCRADGWQWPAKRIVGPVL